MDEVNFPYPHDRDPDIFREALSYSEAVTGFTASLMDEAFELIGRIAEAVSA